MSESWKLGFGEPVGISAETGEGFVDFYGALQPHIDIFYKSRGALQDSKVGEKTESPNLFENAASTNMSSGSIKVAIMGLPNVVSEYQWNGL